MRIFLKKEYVWAQWLMIWIQKPPTQKGQRCQITSYLLISWYSLEYLDMMVRHSMGFGLALCYSFAEYRVARRHGRFMLLRLSEGKYVTSWWVAVLWVACWMWVGGSVLQASVWWEGVWWPCVLQAGVQLAGGLLAMVTVLGSWWSVLPTRSASSRLCSMIDVTWSRRRTPHVTMVHTLHGVKQPIPKLIYSMLMHWQALRAESISKLGSSNFD